MDDVQFDRLARILGVGGTRRAATRLLAGGALGTLFGRLGLAPAIGAERGGHCRGVRDACHRDDQCCSDRCEHGFCTCKTRGKCETGKACCSGKCRDGKCVHVKDPGVDAKWDCEPKKYLCFRHVQDIGTCRVVNLRRVEVPTCFTGIPKVPCLPGIPPKCPRTPCQECNARFPACEGQCRAAERCGPEQDVRNLPVC